MEQQKQDKNKVKKAFEKSLLQVTAILGGTGPFKPLKANASQIELAMQEVAKEEKEELIGKVKSEAKALIQGKRDFDQKIRQKQQEFDKTVEEEQKKFTERAKGLFKLVENINALEQTYRDTLVNAGTGTINEAPVEEAPEEEEE